MKSYVKIFGYIFTILAVSTYQLYPYIVGNLIGDPFDGRLMVVLHEHWINVLKGNQEIRDTGFFYPIKTGLGFSDAFVFQGFIYVIIRFFVSDLLTSWALTNSIVLILGNIGLVLIARELIEKYLLRIFMIITVGTSFAFLSHFYIYTNVNGYILTIYSSFFLIKIFQNNKIPNSRIMNFSVLGLAMVFPLQLLSGWYAAFYSAIFVLVFLITNLVFKTKKTLDQITTFLNNMNKKVLLMSLLILISLVSLWAYIYLPTSGEVFRSKQEILDGSPSMFTFLKSNYFGGGIFNFIHEFFSIEEFPSYDRSNFGITFSVIFAWLFSGIYLLKSQMYKNILYIWMSSTFLMLIFVKFGDFSLFSYLYQFFPPLGSVRAPIRYLSIFAVTNIIIFIIVLDKLNRKYQSKKNSKYLIFICLVIISLDQIRFEYPSWKRSDYLDSRFEDQYSAIKKECTSFYIESEGLEWWDDQLNGMIVSAKLGIPTFNGYSGGFPKDFPNQAWRSETNLLEFGKWLNRFDASKGSCIVRNTKVERFDNPVFIESSSGFDLLESSKNNTWRWSTSKNSEYRIINYSNSKISGLIKFDVKPAQCLTDLNLKIQHANWEEIINIETGASKDVVIPVQMNPQSIKSIEFTVENELCNVDNDPRLLAFNVLNAKFVSN